jgi:hypothetical protein
MESNEIKSVKKDYLRGCIECGGPAPCGEARMILWNEWIPMYLCLKCWDKLNIEKMGHRQWLMKLIEWCDKIIKYAPQYYMKKSYEDKKADLEKDLEKVLHEESSEGF